MVFSSISFLFLFLPLSLSCYYLAGNRFKNIVFILFSLLFYVWGEGPFCLILLLSLLINFFIGKSLDNSKDQKRRKQRLVAGVLINLALLFFFKYASWIADLLDGISPGFLWLKSGKDIHQPVGISFFTFQALSYLIDVFRQKSDAQKNFIGLGLYFFAFPKILAGPIVRYQVISEQIAVRVHNFTLFADGAEKFIYGLGKKVLIANQMAGMSDIVFAQNSAVMTPVTAWLGVICYTLQIYFDFSGYSDMAIGLGKMFGFNFQENFNYPYISRSIQEFWRRWHISLSEWFREYLYIPLGGNRLSKTTTYRNLLIVFLLCGLWHGANWTFVCWGMFHGFFIVAERALYGNQLKKYGILAHCYCLFIIQNAWVLFRADTLTEAANIFQAMYSFTRPFTLHPLVGAKIDILFSLSFLAGLIFSTPILPKIKESFKALPFFSGKASILLIAAKILLLFSLFLVSISFLAVNLYNPFIYFRF